jgi:hypothetical protein
MGEIFFPLSESFQIQKELTLDLEVEDGVRFRSLLSPRPLLTKAAEDVTFPSSTVATWWQRWSQEGETFPLRVPLWTRKQAQFLASHGALVRALLSSPGLEEEWRERLYERLSDLVFLEWMYRSTPVMGDWLATRSLGSLLALGTASNLVPPGVGERLSTREFPLAVRIGPDGRLQQGLKERSMFTPGTWDDQGRFWIRLKGLEAGRPRRAELGLQAGGGESWGSLLVFVGGRSLRLPLLEEDLWRFQGLPPAWYEEAVESDGSLRIGFSFLRDPGYQVPGNFFISRMRIQAVFDQAPSSEARSAPGVAPRLSGGAGPGSVTR